LVICHQPLGCLRLLHKLFEFTTARFDLYDKGSMLRFSFFRLKRLTRALDFF
jgi:hypothetical protein